MKAELKQKWVDALRSGKYRQGRALLCNASRAMCCLGVLLDIEGPSSWSTCVTTLPGEIAHYLHENSNYSGDFPSAGFRRVHGLTTEMDDGETIGHHLAWMNDHGASFAEIADWIDQHIPVANEFQSDPARQIHGEIDPYLS